MCKPKLRSSGLSPSLLNNDLIMQVICILSQVIGSVCKSTSPCETELLWVQKVMSTCVLDGEDSPIPSTDIL